MKHKILLILPALILLTIVTTALQVRYAGPRESPRPEPALTSSQANGTSAAPSLSGDVQEAWVRHYASGSFPGEDAATAVAGDNGGNVYVTGSSENYPFGVDFFTVKYDAAGNQAWAVRYREGTALDFARAIAVDNSGNVYVTGSSDEGTGALEDYATVKYNSTGVEQWAVRYNSPDNLSDVPAALVVDDFGNVYVTGAIGALTVSDYLTVKYDASGNQQWIARYAGPVGRDNAIAIGVDGSGNVYVTGTSAGSGTSNDYATIKYNASGVEQWVIRYNGPGNSFEEARGLVLDAAANVYVTGRSVGSSTQADYATIKYSPSGAEQWVARHNGPAGNRVDEPFALALDGSGNVYVTGGSIGSGSQVDCATVKYNSSGIERWVARYNGPGNPDDKAVALAVDGAGNVYVIGESGAIDDYLTIKYDASGVEQWVGRYNGPANASDAAAALALDASGNIYVAGGSQGSDTGTDYAAIKYNTAGAEQWSARYNGPGNSDDDAGSVAVDGSGNIYVTGRSAGTDRKTDYATIKYDASGVEQWVKRYNGPGNDDDGAGSSPAIGPGFLSVDVFGNVYVTGFSVGSGTGFDCATIKYNAFGVEQWVARHHEPGSTNEGASNIAVDGLGNVYIAGGTAASNAPGDFLTIKYNASGVEQWVARYNGPGNAQDGPDGLAVDASGNVYVTGYSEGSGTGGYATIKYDAFGAQQWVARYEGSIQTTFPSALVIDASRNVYVTGYDHSGTSQDYATIKYNALGVQQWVARYRGPTSGGGGNAIAVDGSGNVYVTGLSFVGMSSDCATIKYNSSGAEQWAVRYNGPGNGVDVGVHLLIDGSGDVYVTGSSEGSGTGFVYVTIKYNASGVEQWVARYDGPANSFALALAIDNSENVYVTGRSEGQGPAYSAYTTIKYSQTPVSVEERGPNSPSTFVLLQNYPNPFNPATTIRFSLPSAQVVSLKVFDLAGNQVTTLINHERKPTGQHEILFDASGLANGVYLYRLQAGNFSETKKMLLVK